MAGKIAFPLLEMTLGRHASITITGEGLEDWLQAATWHAGRRRSLDTSTTSFHERRRRVYDGFEHFSQEGDHFTIPTGPFKFRDLVWSQPPNGLVDMQSEIRWNMIHRGMNQVNDKGLIATLPKPRTKRVARSNIQREFFKLTLQSP